jgi:hypothetical protein
MIGAKLGTGESFCADAMPGANRVAVAASAANNSFIRWDLCGAACLTGPVHDKFRNARRGLFSAVQTLQW